MVTSSTSRSCKRCSASGECSSIRPRREGCHLCVSYSNSCSLIPIPICPSFPLVNPKLFPCLDFQANQASGWKAVEAAANLRKLSEAMPELELILQVNEDTTVAVISILLGLAAARYETSSGNTRTFQTSLQG